MNNNIITDEELNAWEIQAKSTGDGGTVRLIVELRAARAVVEAARKIYPNQLQALDDSLVAYDSVANQSNLKVEP